MADSDGEHWERLVDTEHDVLVFGELEGLAVQDEEKWPFLFLHGSDRSAAFRVKNTEFVDGLARAGVELEALIEEDDDD